MLIVKKTNWKLAIGIPLSLFIICFLITLTNKFKINQRLLSNAIIIDLLITAPLAYYMVIRKTTTSKLTIARVFIIGLPIAGMILNIKTNPLLQLIKVYISPIIEAIIILFISRKFYIANKAAKQKNKSEIDFLSHCRLVMFKILGNEKIANIISSEIAVIYYAFFSRKDKAVDYKTRFTSYKENGILFVLGTFLSLFLIETFGTHLIINKWSSTIAWVLTGLSLYTCIQLFAHIKAIRTRSIIINDTSFEVHNGLAGDALIQFEDIEKLELSNKIPANCQSIKIALIGGLENHNIVVYLKEPISVTRVFGIIKQTNTVLFYVDRPKDFLASLKIFLIKKTTIPF